MQETEARRREQKAIRKHELDLARAENRYSSITIIDNPILNYKVTYFEKGTDLEAFLSVFDIETRNINWKSKVLYLKKAFVKSSVASLVAAYEGEDATELK